MRKKLSAKLEKKYRTLVREKNINLEILLDAESSMVEEMSAAGFVSKETRQKVAEVKSQYEDADFELYCFKQDNADFVAGSNAKREKARKEEAESSFERFWNN